MHLAVCNNPETLIACYGKPRRTRRHQNIAANRSSRPATSAGTPLPISADNEYRFLQRCSSAPAGSPKQHAIVVLGPRNRGVDQENTADDVLSLPPSTATSTKRDPCSLSIDELKCIAHKKRLAQGAASSESESPFDPPVGEVGEMIPITEKKVKLDLAREFHCAACAQGFCASRGFPHGPDGYVDRARIRLGPRPGCSSQLMVPLAEDDGLRPGMGFGALGRRRKGRTASMAEWSGDGSASYDVFDYVEYWDGGGALSPLGNTWAVRAAKRETKPRNPFVEFEDREQRLQQERQWLLEEDGMYMQEKKKDLRHNRVQNHINLNWQEEEQLYDGRVFYGPYSMDMKEKKQGKKSPKKLDFNRSLSSTAGRKRNTTNKRGDGTQETCTDPSCLEVKVLQVELEGAMQKAKRQFEAEDEAKKNRKEIVKLKHQGLAEHFQHFKQTLKLGLS